MVLIGPSMVTQDVVWDIERMLECILRDFLSNLLIWVQLAAIFLHLE